MNTFFSFENQDTLINYFFTKQHFIILLISLVIIIFFSMYATRQNFKFQKRFVIASTILLLIFEIARIVWQYFYIKNNNGSLDFVNILNLDIFTLSLWISFPLIFISIIKKKKKDKNTILLNFVFAIPMVIAIMNLIYPTGVNANFEFYHFYNLMFTLIRSLVIMLGLFLAFSKWISVGNFLDLWKSFVSLVIFGFISILVYFLCGNSGNLLYVSYIPLFETLGIHLNFPWHFIVLGSFIFVLQVIIFFPFYIYKKIKHKN